MHSMKRAVLGFMALIAAAIATPALATDYTHSTPGAGGYDVVAYFMARP